MPEQLTKYPEVTLEVLASGGARCAQGLAPAILKACPAERFCRLPGGELCVYGLDEAARMTQLTPADWQALLPARAPPPAPASPASSGADAAAAPWLAGGLVAGLLAGLALGRLRRPRP